MKREHDRLRVIEGGTPKPKRPRKTGHPLRCHKCDGNAFREVILSPMTDGSRTWGGTRQLVCDHCGEPYSAR
tara:strand:+ start:21 stop:236 length:216 start_codon:yes stop_codon:yes gene_type:complete